MSTKKRELIPHPTDPSLFLVPLTKGYFAVVSAVDVTEVGRHLWYACVPKNGGPVYAAHNVRTGKKVRLEYLHWFIGNRAGLEMKHQVDHDNGNGLDCRRSNLRDATHSQNMWNRRMGKNNTSGIKGVSLSSRGKWRAQISIDGKRKHIGVFASTDEAERAVRDAREKLHSNFANHGTVH